MIIAIDFDGTAVSHAYPAIGEDIGAIPVLKELLAQGHKLILFTMRCDEKLDAAVQWFQDNKIKLYGIQKNPDQHGWTSSPKPYAHIYIDDAALGCPLTHDPNISHRPFVDWTAVRKLLVEQEFLKP